MPLPLRPSAHSLPNFVPVLPRTPSKLWAPRLTPRTVVATTVTTVRSNASSVLGQWRTHCHFKYSSCSTFPAGFCPSACCRVAPALSLSCEGWPMWTWCTWLACRYQGFVTIIVMPGVFTIKTCQVQGPINSWVGAKQACKHPLCIFVTSRALCFKAVTFHHNVSLAFPPSPSSSSSTSPSQSTFALPDDWHSPPSGHLYHGGLGLQCD